MKAWHFVVLLVLTVKALAQHGIIETADGKRFEGEIALDADAFVISDAESSNRIGPALLAHLKFQPPAETNSAAAGIETHGLRGTYFEQENLTGKSVVRIDPAIDFNWGLGAPADFIGSDHFSVRWEGQLEAPATGPFTFFTQADDGVRLYLGNRLLIDKWNDHSATEFNASTNLEAGKRYDLKLEYHDNDAGAFARLYWSGPDIPHALVPTTNLFAPPRRSTNAPSIPTTGLLGLYFNEPDLTGPFKVRYDATIDFDWGASAPFGGVNPDRFSVRWTGWVTAPVTEHFAFHTVTDDGVRLWLANKLIIDSWREEFQNLVSIPMILQAGQRYEFKMEMFDAAARAMAKLYWSSPSIQRQIIPAWQFTPAPLPDPASPALTPKFPAGIALADGSILACRFNAADESSIKPNGLPGLTNVSTIRAARLLFQPISVETAAALPSARVGLLLANKDFIEGDFKELKNGKIRVYSVLFGLKTYETSKVLAVILRDVKPAPARFEVLTRDDSRLLLQDIAVAPDGVRVSSGALAGLKVPATNLAEIKTSNKISQQAKAGL